MSRIIHKSLVDRPRQLVPCLRNRLVATFECTSLPDFESAGRAIQPVFQALGFAYPMYFRATPDQPVLTPTNINLRGGVHQLALVLPLCDPRNHSAATAQSIATFRDTCNKIGETLAAQTGAKNWFARRTSGAVPKLITPEFNRSPEESLALGEGYARYLKGLPAYQRHVVLEIKGASATADEVSDFAEFVELGQPVMPGVWRDDQLGVVVVWANDVFSLYIPSVPATWKPEMILEGSVDLLRRFVAEFGGEGPTAQEQVARQLITGWRNVLSPIGLQPGDEEAREFFPALSSS
jgi:hypothetical protein